MSKGNALKNMAHLTLVLLALIVTCGPGNGSPEGVTVIDPDRYTGPVITLDSIGNEWQVGGLKENPDDELVSGKAILAVAAMPDNRYVTASEHRLRLFDSTGREVWRQQNKGAGPGEFGWIYQLCAVGADEVLVWDTDLYRYSLLQVGTGRVSDLSGPYFSTSTPACSRDGWFIVGKADGVPDTSLVRFEHDVFDRTGSALGSIDGGTAPAHPVVGVLVPVSVGVVDSLIFRADPETGIIAVFTLSGDTLRRLQWRDRSIPVNDASIDQFSRANSDGNAATEARFRQHFAAMERAPYWSRFMVVMSGGGGMIWIAEPLDSPEAMTLWGVSIDGEVVAKVLVPRTGDQGLLGFFPGGILHSWRDGDGALHMGARRVAGTGNL